MMRPKLIARLTIRLPDGLLEDLQIASVRRGCSVNEVVLSGVENELARLLTYRLSYYQLRKLDPDRQGDNGRQLSALSDTNF